MFLIDIMQCQSYVMELGGRYTIAIGSGTYRFGEFDMTTTISKMTKFTYAGYLNPPDDKKYELIEGELVMTPSPILYHQCQ